MKPNWELVPIARHLFSERQDPIQDTILRMNSEVGVWTEERLKALIVLNKSIKECRKARKSARDVYVREYCWKRELLLRRAKRRWIQRVEGRERMGSNELGEVIEVN